MNIFFELKNNLIEIISKLADQSQSSISEKQFNSFTVEPTRDKKHGDLATNAAMVFCKNFGL
ncbi:MAG: arginyl-tRNA synthetase, partial [Rickettsiales bacterium]